MEEEEKQFKGHTCCLERRHGSSDRPESPFSALAGKNQIFQRFGLVGAEMISSHQKSGFENEQVRPGGPWNKNIPKHRMPVFALK